MDSKIVVLFGGSSSERRVSVASAQNVSQTLPHAELWFLAASGTVHGVAPYDLLAHQNPFERDFLPPQPVLAGSMSEALDRAPRDSIFLLALHGGEGENGQLQLELEGRRLAFTGSGSVASALAFDKQRTREVMAAQGIRVAQASHVHGGEAASLQTQLTQQFRQRGRLVAKPTADGSSIGLHHLTDEAAIASAARAIAAAGSPYLIEDFVQGTELTVGVIEDGENIVSLPASEVRVEAGRAFDFEGKYLGRGTREITPAELPEDLTRVARAAAVTAHRALGCYGYSRTDLIASDSDVTFLETNTLPGLTRTSFIPQQLEADGRTLAGFLERQIALAVGRRDRG